MFTAEEESYLTIPDIEPVRTFLANALNLRLNGDKAQYELIVNQLRVRDDPDTLWKVLVALCSFTYQLTKQAEDFRALLNCIFCYDWKCDIKVTVAVIHLINQIVSTNSTFLGRAFQLYVKSLLPSMTTSITTESTEDGLEARRQLIHRAIRGILTQVPTGRSVLFPILSEFFPHKRFSRNVQVEYTTQLLHICQYEPMLQAKVLELIIAKCLEMDVEIVIEESGEVRIDPEALDDGDLDFADAFSDFGNSNNNSRTHSRNNSMSNVHINSNAKRKQLTEATPTRIPAEVSEMADKLDSVLLLLVQFCEAQISQSSGTRDRLLQQLLSIFENTIMCIHKSKFVQFVVFYAASLHGAFAQAVAEKLLAITLDEKTSSSQRQSAVMYLSSYLSRATFLEVDFISGVLNRLLAWAALYVVRTGGALAALSSPVTPHGSSSIKASISTTSITALSGHTSREASTESVSLRLSHSTSERSLSAVGGVASSSSKSSPLEGAGFAQDIEYDEYGRAFVREVTVSRHELFYSVVQSVCYTLCFHGVELAEMQRDQEAVRVHWETVVSSKYDPLRYCLKSVRIEFVRLAATVGLFSARCWGLISTDLLYTDILLQQQQLVEKVRTSDNVTLTTFTTNEATSHHTISRNQVQSQGIIVSNGSHREVYSANTLDSFFPFDPCLLCKLHQAVQKGYRAWDGVPGLDEDADSFNEDFVSDDEDADEEVSSREYKASRSIPMRRTGAGKAGHEHSGTTPGSNASSMMDHFTTSSLSSVVSSIACTDMAMSIASSAHMGSYVGSYLSANMRENAQPWDVIPQRKGSDFDADDDDVSDSGMHEAHMHIPPSQLNTSSASSGPGVGIAAAGQEQFESTFRRPRFYSIGSTGSW